MSIRAVSGKHQDGTAWAKTPPPGGARGSRWESAILELAEAGEPRFVKILAEHVASGVIASPRATAALEPGNAAA
ncbi:MAG: hypothetical protein ACRCTX_24475 [Afipia sp.]